jgi:endoglucanase
MRVRSESVHISHIGFRPDDPVKTAFLSLWMGTGGGYSFAERMPFTVVDDASGERVFQGRAEPAWRADRPEKYGRQVNYVKAGVARLDFSELKRAGRYRVCAEGIGCSYPFEIAADVWDRAFRLSMTGQYVHRSGIELGPPYTEFKRPRCFHPDDGVRVYQSTCSLMHSGNGLNILGTEANNFDCLVKGRTDQVVPGVWGGYMDAGDWDRRIQHLEATRLHLELMELMPGEFAKTKLNLPESGNALPDLVDEALFGLDVYRRLQMPDGGIRGGIESSEHPVSGETSWLESQMVLTYAPDPWSSYAYAGVAARAALVLRGFDARLAGEYEGSAIRALRWAETEWVRWKGSADFAKARQGAIEEVERERVLALLEAYRLTRDPQWHERFVAALPPLGGFSKLADAAFVYARLPKGLGEAAFVAEAAREVAAGGERAVEFSRNNAFGLATAHLRPGPYGAFYTVPADPQLVRAHALTKRPEFLEAIIRGAQYSAGANPINMTMTSDVGHDSPRNMLHEDMKHSGQPMPAGVTVYGPYDLAMVGPGEKWVMPMLEKQCTPPPREWPAAEAYFDIYIWASMTEYTVMQTLGPTAYVWGYLAKRP